MKNKVHKEMKKEPFGSFLILFFKKSDTIVIGGGYLHQGKIQQISCDICFLIKVVFNYSRFSCEKISNSMIIFNFRPFFDKMLNSYLFISKKVLI